MLLLRNFCLSASAGVMSALRWGNVITRYLVKMKAGRKGGEKKRRIKRKIYSRYYYAFIITAESANPLSFSLLPRERSASSKAGYLYRGSPAVSNTSIAKRNVITEIVVLRDAACSCVRRTDDRDELSSGIKREWASPDSTQKQKQLIWHTPGRTA